MVPTVYPGRVYVAGEEKPPVASKWDGVDTTTECRIEADEMLLSLERVRRDDRGRNYVRFSKEDVAKLKGEYHRKWLIVLAGIAVSGARPMMSASTRYTSAKALLGRAFRMSKVQAKPGIWKWAEKFESILLPDTGHGTGFHRDPMTPEEWLSSMPTARRTILTKAMERYLRWGWKKGYESFKAFVKAERLPGFGKSEDEVWLDRDFEMLDRLIQAPSEESHCVVGPELKPFVAQLKEKWTSASPIFYGSCPPEHLEEWLRKTLIPESEHQYLYFWCDFKMYDNTHSDQTWDYMEGLYERAGIYSEDFWSVMRAWRRPKGKIGPFRYRARVMNASGRDDTALANGVLNGIASYLSLAAAYLNVPLTTLTPEQVEGCFDVLRLSVCGDDSLGRLPILSADEASAFAKRVRANIAAFGFEAKLDYSDRLHDAVYLGKRPYPTTQGWVWGNVIGRSVYKLGWIDHKPGRDPTAIMHGIAEMHRTCSAPVPILSDLAEKICQLCTGLKLRAVERDPNRPWEWTLGGAAYDEATLEYVAQVYSHKNRPLCSIVRACDYETTVEDVRQVITHIQQLDALPAVIGDPLPARVLRLMIWQDDL